MDGTSGTPERAAADGDVVESRPHGPARNQALPVELLARLQEFDEPPIASARATPARTPDSPACHSCRPRPAGRALRRRRRARLRRDLYERRHSSPPRLGEAGVSLLMLMAKSRREKPENVRKHSRPSPETIAWVTSLLAPGDSRRRPSSAGEAPERGDLCGAGGVEGICRVPRSWMPRPDVRPAHHVQARCLDAAQKFAARPES